MFFFFLFFPPEIKGPLTGSLPHFQWSYTHDSQICISRTDSSRFWEPNNCCLLDTSLKLNKCLKLNTCEIKWSSFQTPFSSCDAPPAQRASQPASCPSQTLDIGHCPRLLSLHYTHHLFSPYVCQLCLLLELVYFPSSQLLLSSFRSLQKGRHSPPTRSLVSGLASLQPTPSTIMSHSILQDLVPNYILDLVLPLIPTYSMFLAIFKHLSCL